MADELELEIEPEGAIAAELVEAIVGTTVGPPIGQVLGGAFPLETLLTFLPDPRLKAKADRLAAEALAIEVKGPDGIAAADAALVPTRQIIGTIKERFRDPCDLANQLHKRLTGLRGEFLKAAEDAVDQVGRRIYAETRRLEAVAAEARRKAQEEADRLERERARLAADAAMKAQAPAPVVQELTRRAETAVAAPVPVAAPIAPANSTIAAKWKARLVGTTGGDDTEPATKQMSDAQRASLLLLVQAVAEGRASLSLLEINWSVANKRAENEGTTMGIPGLEAYDAGGLRAKRRR